ncbi:hypothetical protein P7C70_g4681, partial [Phenoliferia sp. Uapishka_3]
MMRMRPPSPPQSSSGSASTKSSPTFTNSSVLTPPDSPHISPSPSPLQSPIPALTGELFRLTLAFLAPSPNECKALLLVSHAWYSFIVSEPQLWTHLTHWLDREDHVERARTWSVFSSHLLRATFALDFEQRLTFRTLFRAARASVNGGGRNASRCGIRSLVLGLGRRRENSIDVRMANSRFGQLLDDLHNACVVASPYDAFGHPLNRPSSTLVQMVVNLSPHSPATKGVLASLAESSSEALFNNLMSLELYTGSPNFLITNNFFALWPTLSIIRLVCASQPVNVVGRQSDYGWTGEKHPMAIESHLRQLLLKGTTIRELALPAFPYLAHISLHDVAWEGRSFFLLMRLCRKTLVSLECIDFEMLEVEGAELEDWQMFVDVRDPQLVDDHFFAEVEDDSLEDEVMEDVAPIVFPVLQSLHLSHEITPPFFASLEYADYVIDGQPSYPTPDFVMPCLTRAIMDDISFESDADEGNAPLAVFGRSAPHLLQLQITASLANDQSVFSCLAGMQGRLRCLTLTDTNISDRLLVHLPSLTPRLQELDVRRCDVTVQGVARLVEVSRDACSRPDNIGAGRIMAVRVDPPRWGDAEFIAYRWLAYVGILVREEWDFESEGPAAWEDRRRWIKAGKLDLEKEEQRRWREERRREEERKQQATLAAARQQVFPQYPLASPFLPPHPPQPQRGS